MLIIVVAVQIPFFLWKEREEIMYLNFSSSSDTLQNMISCTTAISHEAFLIRIEIRRSILLSIFISD